MEFFGDPMKGMDPLIQYTDICTFEQCPEYNFWGSLRPIHESPRSAQDPTEGPLPVGLGKSREGKYLAQGPE